MKTVLGLLAVVAVASAMEGMPMPGMLAGLQGLMGDGSMKDMMGDMLKNAPAMLKNLKKEDIERALDNMPPEMRQMVEGMGISKEQIESAVDNLPQMVSQFETSNGEIDTDKIKTSVKGMLEGEMAKMGMDPTKMEEEAQVMLPRIKETLVQKAKDMGIDYKEGDDIQSLMPQIKEAAVRELKKEGVDIDLEDPEASLEKIKGQMKEFVGANADDDEEEVKSKVTKNMLNQLRSRGFDVDPEKPQESMNRMKSMAFAQAKAMGMDIKEDSTPEEMKELIFKKLEDQGIPCRDKAKLMQFAMKKLMGSFMSNMMGGGRPPMPMPRPMPQPMPQMPMPQQPMRPQQPYPMNLNLEINVEEGDRPTSINMGGNGHYHHEKPSQVVEPEYVHGAKDALQNAFDDQEVIRHVMAVEYGIKNGVVSEEAITEILQDMLHYRLMAKVLIAKNHMLESNLAMAMRPRIMHRERPVMSRSPILRALMSKF